MPRSTSLFIPLLFSILLLLSLFYYFFIYEKLEITAEEAKQNRKKGKYDYIVDVRTDEEWNLEHLEGTISIPIGRIVTELPKQIPNRNARILFICKKGIRSSAVIIIAHKLGYTHVQSMIGNYKDLL